MTPLPNIYDGTQSLPSGVNLIGTHSGAFHCDEVLACALLRQLPEFQESSIVRTRDPEVLALCKIVVDVGGVYEPGKNRYDHHQRGFTETMNSNKRTKLSSAGLIYKHFGKEILSLLTESEEVDVLYHRIYDSFIEHIDGIDNGIEAFDGTKNYEVTTTLSSRVGRLNPQWNERDIDVNQQFLKAMELCEAEFKVAVKHAASSWLPARTIVLKALQAASHTPQDLDPRILILEEYAPWQSHIFPLEQLCNRHIIYVVYEDSGGSWRVQAVPVAESSFTSRLPLPEPWRGVRDKQLADLADLPSAIFVHASGFIGGTKTKEDAIKMATSALNFESS